MGNVTHFRHGTQPCSWKESGVSDAPLCKGDSFILDSYTDDPAAITCPKCSSKWALGEIKRLGLDVRVERDETPRYGGYRSVYKVFINGSHYGYVTLDGGKRAKWVIRDHGYDTIKKTYNRKNGGTFELDITGLKSKEQAALQLLEHIEKFETIEAYDKRIADLNNIIITRRAQAERERDQRAEDLGLAIEEITRMRANSALTNLETAALDTALAAMKEVLELEKR